GKTTRVSRLAVSARGRSTFLTTATPCWALAAVTVTLAMVLHHRPPLMLHGRRGPPGHRLRNSRRRRDSRSAHWDRTRPLRMAWTRYSGARCAPSLTGSPRHRRRSSGDSWEEVLSHRKGALGAATRAATRTPSSTSTGTA